MKYITGTGLLFAVALFFSCSSSKEKAQIQLANGDWIFEFENTKEGQAIPIRATVSDKTITFRNGDELIHTQITEQGDSTIVSMPVFGTYFKIDSLESSFLKGEWVNPFKDPVYRMPISATLQEASAHQNSGADADSVVYEVTFSPGTDSSYPAVGVFVNQADHLRGTFMTETGDYRFLEGEVEDDKAWMSCFDGAHLFYFQFDPPGDSLIEGSFYSGKHYYEPWTGYLNPEAELTHPDSLTSITTDPSNWNISIHDDQLSLVELSSSSLQGQVTLIQILGTWCPNCMDESRYFKEIYQTYSEQGLNIIPVAFERGSDSLKWQLATQTYQESLELPYPFYIGGSASKGRAGEVFDMLSSLSSFPTTLFIDRSGTIRRVHTGFYGPGTGHYYDRYRENTQLFIEQLLSEDHSASSPS